MSQTTARLGLPLIMPAQAQKHVTHNEALSLVDLLVQAVLEATSAAVPPGIPAEGGGYGLGPAPTGAWAGHAGEIARWQDGGWRFVPPAEGWIAYDRDSGRVLVHDGADWAPLASAMDFGQIPQIGVNTTADATNRLAARADATLLTGDGGGHQLKINKTTGGDTASLLFQSGWTGYAEMGLAGNNRFAIKVSDGSAWTTALDFTAAGIASGAAVQSSATDTTAGRLMAVGAFGLGAPPGAAITDLTAALAPGFYRFVGSTTTGSPTNVSTTCSIIVMSSGNAGVSQTSIVVRGAQATNNSQMWIGMRFALTGAWTWIEITTHANLLGTVSQSAGAPTGAVIERGSGANGHYTRLADGTQICWFALAAVGGAGKTWTFPAAFSAAPVVTGNAQASVLSAVCLDSAPGTTSVTFSTRDKADARRADTCHLTATGRWF